MTPPDPDGGPPPNAGAERREVTASGDPPDGDRRATKEVV